jgi:hypothetical protein
MNKMYTRALILFLPLFGGGMCLQGYDYSYDDFVNHAFCSTGHSQPGSQEDYDIQAIQARRDRPFSVWLGLRKSTSSDAFEQAKEFVYETTYDQAFLRTRSHTVATRAAQYVSEQFVSTADRYTDPTQPSMGAYSQFVGKSLDRQIEFAIERCCSEQYAPSAPPEPEEISISYKPDNKKANEARRTNDFDPCHFCTELYQDTNERVYFPRLGSEVTQYGLYKTCCGHWACVDCTLNWFSSQNKSTCPFCRQAVDKGLLQKILSSR